MAVEWRHHSNQAGTPRRATNPQSGGHRPKKRLRRHGTMADGPRRHWCTYQRRCGNAGSLVSTHRRAPPAGERPEERRVPTQPKDWQALLFNTVGDQEFFLAFGKCVSEVVRGSFILVWVYVGIGHRVPIVLSCSALRFSLHSLFFWRCASYVLAIVSFARFGPPRAISEVVSLGLPGRPARASPGA